MDPAPGEQDALSLGAVEGVAAGVPGFVAASPAVIAGVASGDRIGGPHGAPPRAGILWREADLGQGVCGHGEGLGGHEVVGTKEEAK